MAYPRKRHRRYPASYRRPKAVPMPFKKAHAKAKEAERISGLWRGEGYTPGAEVRPEDRPKRPATYRRRITRAYEGVEPAPPEIPATYVQPRRTPVEIRTQATRRRDEQRAGRLVIAARARQREGTESEFDLKILDAERAGDREAVIAMGAPEEGGGFGPDAREIEAQVAADRKAAEGKTATDPAKQTFLKTAQRALDLSMLDDLTTDEANAVEDDPRFKRLLTDREKLQRRMRPDASKESYAEAVHRWVTRFRKIVQAAKQSVEEVTHEEEYQTAAENALRSAQESMEAGRTIEAIGALQEGIAALPYEAGEDLRKELTRIRAEQEKTATATMAAEEEREETARKRVETEAKEAAVAEKLRKTAEEKRAKLDREHRARVFQIQQVDPAKRQYEDILADYNAVDKELKSHIATSEKVARTTKDEDERKALTKWWKEYQSKVDSLKAEKKALFKRLDPAEKKWQKLSVEVEEMKTGVGEVKPAEREVDKDISQADMNSAIAWAKEQYPDADDAFLTEAAKAWLKQRAKTKAEIARG